MMRLLSRGPEGQVFHDQIDRFSTYVGINLEYKQIQELKKAKNKYLVDQQSKFSSGGKQVNP